MIDRRDFIAFDLYKDKLPKQEFNFDMLTMEPMGYYLSYYDIMELHKIASSVRLASKPKQKYEMIDYYINAAPIVSTGAERFKTDKFIKVNDPVEGYIIKQYNADSNEYEVYQLIPAKDGHESTENRLRRLQNFVEFCPFEMPMMAKITEMFSVINFDGEVTEDILDKIKKILIDFSSSGKLIVYKDC